MQLCVNIKYLMVQKIHVLKMKKYFKAALKTPTP